MSDSAVGIGSITITYDIAEGGDILTGVDVDGDLPVVTILGLLRMAEDTILHGPDDDEDEVLDD